MRVRLRARARRRPDAASLTASPRAAQLFALWAFASSAGAQFSGTATVVSDYRYRGITLSDDKPAVQAGLNYDMPQGWYAGAFGSTVRLAPPVGVGVQGIVFGGFASRLPSGVALEAGGDYSMFSGTTYDNYGELFVGAATENVGARVYYSPHYFGQGGNAVYGELNASYPLAGSFRFIAHVGLLSTQYYAVYGAPPERTSSTVGSGSARISAASTRSLPGSPSAPLTPPIASPGAAARTPWY